MTVKLSKAPVAGDVVVLFFEANKTFKFPYSGQVSWPQTESGSQWSFDGQVNSTAVLHHVVQAGESGTYTINVGGTGSGYADYMVAEVQGANASNPVNARGLHSEPKGTTQFNFGSGVTPTAAGTFPIAFFSAHSSGLTWQSISSGWTIGARNGDYSEMIASGPVQTGTSAVNTTATLSAGSSLGASDVVLLNPAVTSTSAPVTSTAAPAPATTSAPQFSVVQTAANGFTYSSTMTVKLPKAPAAGDALVLFFETNHSFRFPYSGQVTWPQTETGSQWSFDGQVNSTAVLHHVVQSGETGTYTVNVGGAGSGYADYMVAEVRGANASNPVNARTLHGEPSGTTQFNFGSGVTPSVAGTFPVAFFSAHSSGLTWQSIGSGWTIAARNGDYSEMIASGPVQTGTSTVNTTATLSSGSGAGASDVVLLNPASTSASTTSTPAPSSTAPPTASPTASPTSAPVSTSGYTYHGCKLFAANDWLTTNLITGGSSYVPNTVDPNSANIVANMASAYPNLNFASDVQPNLEVVNLVPSVVAQPNVGPLDYGWHDDPWGDDPNHTIPISSPFYQEGTSNCPGSGDCHVQVLSTSQTPGTTSSCVEWETYAGSQSWNGSTFTADGLSVYNLNHPYSQQMYGSATAAGIANMGTTDYGEDASLSSIPHIVAFYCCTPNRAVGHYVAPAGGDSGMTCTSYCTRNGVSAALPYGARLRLKSSYMCPSASTYPQANLICNQLKNYGMVFDDTEWSTTAAGIRLGDSANGTDPWHSSDYNQLLNNLKITDFDVMTLGTIH